MPRPSALAMAPAEWVTFTPAFAPAASLPIVRAKMPSPVDAMAPLLVTVTAPAAPAPSCEAKMPRLTRAATVPRSPLLVTERAPPPPLATADTPSPVAAMAPLFPTVMLPDPASRLTAMPCLTTAVSASPPVAAVPAFIAALLSTVIVPAVLRASVRRASMP